MEKNVRSKSERPRVRRKNKLGSFGGGKEKKREHERVNVKLVAIN